jgi:hypothetical protein
MIAGVRRCGAVSRASTTIAFEDLLRRAESLTETDLRPFSNDCVYTTGWQERLRSTGSEAGLVELYRKSSSTSE